MADVKTFRPGAVAGTQQDMGVVSNNNILQVTNQVVDPMTGVVQSTSTTDVVNVMYDAMGDPTVTYFGDVGFADPMGDTVTVLNIDETGDGSNSTFIGASNRLNILNDTANGPAPLDVLGRRNHNVVTLTDTAYEAAGFVADPNTLYLIREEV